MHNQVPSESLWCPVLSSHLLRPALVHLSPRNPLIRESKVARHSNMLGYATDRTAVFNEMEGKVYFFSLSLLKLALFRGSGEKSCTYYYCQACVKTSRFVLKKIDMQDDDKKKTMACMILLPLSLGNIKLQLWFLWQANLPENQVNPTV